MDVRHLAVRTIVAFSIQPVKPEVMGFGKHIRYLLLLGVFFSPTVLAQTSETDTQPVRSARDTTLPNRSSLRTAIALNLAVNLVPFSVDYFVRRKDFANISLESLSTNLQLRSWGWDADQFLNNQFSHPYHGSLYFNSFRAGGYSFGWSAAATFGGSLLWEIAGENETPAVNDLINTTLGGIAWGEMTHRLGSRLIHRSGANKRKKLLTIVGRVVDPMSGVYSLLQPGRQRETRQLVDTTPIRFEFSGGGRQYNREFNNVRQYTQMEGFARLNFTYGVPYQVNNGPFSFFSVMVEMGTSDSAFFNIARIKGSLAGKQFYKNGPSFHAALMSLDYDYYRNTAFAYGMQSLQLALVSRFQVGPPVSVQTELGAQVIGLAAVTEEEPDDYRKRNYDYGAGGGVVGIGSLTLYNRVRWRSNLRVGWLHTLDGFHPGYRVINSTSGLRVQCFRQGFVEYEWGHFFLKGLGDVIPGSVRHTYYKRFSLGYLFRF